MGQHHPPLPLRLGVVLGLLVLAPLPNQGSGAPASAALEPAPLPLWVFRSDASAVNRQPVVGILSQPGDGLNGLSPACRGCPSAPAPGTSYIAASYVKLVEAGGARVVPLVYNWPWPRLRQVGPAAGTSASQARLPRSRRA